MLVNRKYNETNDCLVGWKPIELKSDNNHYFCYDDQQKMAYIFQFLMEESTPKSIFNYKEHKANTKDTKKRVCITTLCALCEISLCTLWYNFLFYRSVLNEKELEDALVANITRFLLELGQGIAYVGQVLTSPGSNPARRKSIIRLPN